MLDTVNIYEAKTRLSALVSQVEAGSEITIARAGRPVAKLVPMRQNTAPIERTGMRGILKGKIWIADDFNEWPPGFWDAAGKLP